MAQSEATPRPWRVVRKINVNSLDGNIIDEVFWGVAAGDREGPFENKGHFHPEEAEYWRDEITVVEVVLNCEYSEYEGGISNEANARLIVQAVNAHEALVEALKGVLYPLEIQLASHVRMCEASGQDITQSEAYITAKARLDAGYAALKLAGGE